MAACILAAGVAVPFVLGIVGVFLAFVLIPVAMGVFARHWATRRSSAAAAVVCGVAVPLSHRGLADEPTNGHRRDSSQVCSCSSFLVPWCGCVAPRFPRMDTRTVKVETANVDGRFVDSMCTYENRTENIDLVHKGQQRPPAVTPSRSRFQQPRRSRSPSDFP